MKLFAPNASACNRACESINKPAQRSLDKSFYLVAMRSFRKVAAVFPPLCYDFVDEGCVRGNKIQHGSARRENFSFRGIVKRQKELRNRTAAEMIEKPAVLWSEEK